MATSPLLELARAKWQSSGLKDEHAKALKLLPMDGAKVKALAANFLEVASLKIPYFDLDGRTTTFYRLRYLEKPTGFAGVAEKPQRYAQPAGTLNQVYLPPLLEKSWSDIAQDASVRIYFTEGEFKSAAGCVAGLATIGLGGVDVWRAGKRGIELLPALAAFVWDGRDVCVVYDSDAATNPNVVRAQGQLSRELLARGAMVSISSLPAAKSGEKQGLDDFLVAHGASQLAKLLEESPAFAEAAALWEMNEEVVYVKDPGLVIERESGLKMAPSAFMQHAYVNRHYLETKVKGKSVTQEKKPLAKRWMEWERRFELERITYAPGKGKLEDNCWNTWPGWGVQPKRGDIGPWKWLLDFLFQDEPVEVRRWFERWCAFPLQHPGTKMYSSAVLWGTHHGTGKTLAAYTLMKIYGKNAIEIKDEDLRGNFNEWAENKQFVYGDEVTGKDGQAKRGDADRLKGLITQHHLRINAKYLPTYVVPDCINYFFTSNHPDAFFLEDNDRRFFIHEVDRTPAETDHYRSYDRWMHSDGPSHLFSHLLHLPLGDFDPKGHALVTRSKKNMIVDNKSDIGLWVNNLKEDPSDVLKVLGESLARNAALFSATQLLQAYDPENSGRVKLNGMARELKRAGFKQVNGGLPIRTASAGLQKLYIIRDEKKWTAAKPKDLAKHFDDSMGGKF
jgi:hypothetical protein